MAGASTKDIKLRIRSVQSTMQITKAMQLVATSKLRRAKEKMEASKPYSLVSEEALASVVASCTDKKVPYLHSKEVKRRCYVVIAGERGLAGGYNSNIFKEVDALVQGQDCTIMPIGRKAIEKYAHSGLDVLDSTRYRVEGVGVMACYDIAQELLSGYNEDRYQEIWLVYTDFKSLMSQEVKAGRLLPVETKDVKPVLGTVYDPDPETVLTSIMPDYLAGRIFSAVCDSFASEVSARRNAMDSATKNASAMIDDLQLRYNRARQGSITQEITEIIAGADS